MRRTHQVRRFARPTGRPGRQGRFERVRASVDPPHGSPASTLGRRRPPEGGRCSLAPMKDKVLLATLACVAAAACWALNAVFAADAFARGVSPGQLAEARVVVALWFPEESPAFRPTPFRNTASSLATIQPSTEKPAGS